jgi:hypothetical protein
MNFPKKREKKNHRKTFTKDAVDFDNARHMTLRLENKGRVGGNKCQNR